MSLILLKTEGVIFICWRAVQQGLAEAVSKGLVD